MRRRIDARTAGRWIFGGLIIGIYFGLTFGICMREALGR